MKWKWRPLSHVWLFVNPWTVVHGILQGRILEWVAYPFSSVSSQSRNGTRVSYIAGGFYQLNHQGVTWEAYLPSNLRNFSNSCLLTLGLGLVSILLFSHKRGLLHLKTVSGRKEGKFVFHWCAKERKNDMLSSSLDNLCFIIPCSMCVVKDSGALSPIA